MNKTYLEKINQGFSEDNLEDHQIFSHIIEILKPLNLIWADIIQKPPFKQCFSITQPLSVIRNQYAYNAPHPFRKEDLEELNGVLSTLAANLTRDLNSFLASVLIYETLIIFETDYLRILIPYLKSQASLTSDFLQLTERFSITIDSNIKSPIYEKESVTDFLKAKENKDFEGMSSFSDSIERGAGIREPWILKFIILYLLVNNIDSFVENLNKKSNLLDIRLFLKNIPVELTIPLLSKTTNHLVFFEIIHILTNTKSDWSESEAIEVSNAIASFFKDQDPLWSAFVKFFITHPSRYPRLMTPFGRALSLLGPRYNSPVLSTFPLRNEDAELYTFLHQGFMNNVSESIAESYLNHIFQVWLSYYETKDFQVLDGEIMVTSLVPGIAHHFLNQCEADYTDFIKTRISYLKNLETKWYPNKTEFIREVEKHLAQLIVALSIFNKRIWSTPQISLTSEFNSLIVTLIKRYRYDLNKTQLKILEDGQLTELM